MYEDECYMENPGYKESGLKKYGVLYVEKIVDRS